jgi:putative phosphoribosyl transferase
VGREAPDGVIEALDRRRHRREIANGGPIMPTRIKSFRDRREAARCLAAKLTKYAGRIDVVVVGLPRGGVVTAFEIADELHLPLDVIVVRKLGAPGQEELAMGAVARGVTIVNEQVVRTIGISKETVEASAERERREVARREIEFRGGRAALDLAGKTVIVADDGLATGSSMRAAVVALRRLGPAKIVLAVPVAPLDVYTHFKNEVDEVICLSMPQPFGAVAFWYDRFEPVADREVMRLLDRAAQRATVGAAV